MKRHFWLSLWIVLLMAGSLFASDWREFQVHSGSCKVLLPSAPNHWHNQIPVENSEHPLNYDVYVAGNNQETIYMMLVADFPKELSEAQESLSIEGFMRGILKDKEESRLLFIDSLKVQGHAAMDFLMKSKQDHFFKGRVIATAKKLYLLTVECTLEHFDEQDYKTFVNSFVLLP
jgi:hypothetical protein